MGTEHNRRQKRDPKLYSWIGTVIENAAKGLAISQKRSPGLEEIGVSVGPITETTEIRLV
jgi:hypothetical protein